MALSNLHDWNKKEAASACGASDKPAACGSADKPDDKPAACGPADKPDANLPLAVLATRSENLPLLPAGNCPAGAIHVLMIIRY